MNSCHCSWTWPRTARAAREHAAGHDDIPDVVAAMSRATDNPTTPPTMKNSVVASEIDVTGQPARG